jgi:hypothetical protein
MTKLPPETDFLVKHGINTSDRISKDLINVIQEILVSSSYEYKGKPLEFKAFGNSGIDVKGVDGFDHIEFTITKTGWGRWCSPEKK